MVPAQYESAWRDFDQLLRDACDESGPVTINQTYTMLEGVFQVFRRRLTLAEAIRFANALPPLARALFVSDWDPAESIRPFMDRARMAEEITNLRPGHNFAPPTAIHDVAFALRRHVRGEAFDTMLASLPPGAVEFWSPEAA